MYQQSSTYGVEWTDHGRRGDPNFIVRLIIVVVLLSVVALSFAVVKRVRADKENDARETSYEIAAKSLDTTEPEKAALVEATEDELTPPPPPPPPPNVARLDRRPTKVRNLLMKLEEAEQRHDIEMAVSAIEQLRNLPGSPAADLDDKLARRLGELNMIRLFEKRNGQWVREIIVKRGDSSSRIAAAYGSTLASFEKLNGGSKPSVKIGEKVFVLNFPRFNLVIHRRSKTADLQLNGKFFKRYDLKYVSGLEDGFHEWRDVSLVTEDRKELEMLLPKSTQVLVSEM